MIDLPYKLAAKLPEFLWQGVQGETCLLPYYHIISNEPVAHVSPLYNFRSVKQFTDDIDYFLVKRKALSLDEFLCSVHEHGSPPRNSFLLSFDDGFREVHDIVLPILMRKGVPAVFFLNSATLDNNDYCHHQKIALLLNHKLQLGNQFPNEKIRELLSAFGIRADNIASALRSIRWNERKILDEVARECEFDFLEYLKRNQPYVTSDHVLSLINCGMSIGAHSINHPIYADISLDEQIHQTQACMESLTRKFPIRSKAFAFPHSDKMVTKAFFDFVYKHHIIDISFGTSSPAHDRFPFNYQRFSVEDSHYTADQFVARNRLKRIYGAARGKLEIERA